MLLGNEPTEYLSALCRREQQWIQLHASSQALHAYRHHPPITRDPSAHLAVLDLFRSVIPQIIPFGPPELVQPTLWHRDLSGSNIFMSETEFARGRISITSIIDWQNTSVGPLYMQARVPNLFEYHAPWNLPDGLEIAALPEDIKDMSKDALKAAKKDVAAKNMTIYYRAAVGRHAPYYYHALTEPYTLLFVALALGASTPWGSMFHIVRMPVPPCHRQILNANLYILYSYEINFLPFNLFGQDILPPLVLCTSLMRRYVLGAWRLNNGRIVKMNLRRSASVLVLMLILGPQRKTSMRLVSGTRRRGRIGLKKATQQKTGRSVVLLS